VIWRNGREEVIEINPSVFFVDNNVYTDDLQYFGVVFDNRYPDRLIIEKVYPDTPAYTAGLRVGDVITDWHGERIKSVRQFEDVLHRVGPGTVDFDYSRDSKAYRGEAKFSERPNSNERREAGRADERRENEPRTNEPRTIEPRTPSGTENPRVNPNQNPREPGRELGREPGANPNPPRNPANPNPTSPAPTNPGSVNPGPTNPGSSSPGPTHPAPEPRPGSRPGDDSGNRPTPTPR
jgi:hypothetical protein